MTYIFSKKAKNYKRKTISDRYLREIAIPMTLNNMKIENQAVPEKKFRAILDSYASNSRQQRNKVGHS